MRAERGYREALAEFQQHGDRRGIAYALEGIARVASSAGEHLEAVRFSGAAQVVRDRIALRRDPMDMSTHEAVMRAAIDALAEPERERAWQAGMLMGAEAAETYLPDGG